MKIGAYFLIGPMISYLVLKTKSEVSNCDVENEGYYICHKSRSTQDSFVIPQNLPADIKGIALSKDLSMVPWMIDDVNYFQRFPELLVLMIDGPVMFSSNLTSTDAKTLELQDKLFSLPKLNLILCAGCGFTSINNNWKLPWDIERLRLMGNSYKEYRFTLCPYLIEINFESNHLNKMPIWEDNPSPLQELYLLDNPELRVTFNDIAKYCQLTNLSLDVSDDGYITKQERSCDCHRIRRWLNEFEIGLIIDKSGSKSTNGDALKCYKVMECTAEKLEEYEKKKEFCYNKRKRKVDYDKRKKPFKASQKLRRIAFVVVFVTFCITASGLLLYAKDEKVKSMKVDDEEDEE